MSLIVAQSENRVIGRNNALPWHLSEDLKYFKKVTMGKPIVMGRKTFESIGKPLPGRKNIVVTRQQDWSHEGVQVCHTLQDAILAGKATCDLEDQEEVMVIGGAEIYALALPVAGRLYLTQVHAEVHGDAFFPELASGDWIEVLREDFPAQEPNPYDYSFIVLDRC